jgi:molybdate transport system ATP-binding protein
MEVSSAIARDAGEQLRVRLRKRLPGEGGSSFILDAGFVVCAGFTILFGASGAGKTTLLDCIAGLQTPDEGEMVLGETVLFDSQVRRSQPPQRRSVGYLMQSLALFPHMTVQQNLEYGLVHLDGRERDTLSREVLDSFRISALAHRRPGEISGGERQRVALARALVTQPRVLLLDEPLTALDAPTKSRMVDDLRAWNRQRRIPILYVTHHRDEVFALGEHLLVLEAGRLVAEGSPHEVLHRPQLESVAQLAGFENIFACSVTGSHPEQGTMTCRILRSAVEIEVPVTRVDASQPLHVGIRAGDVLVASAAPQAISARNVLAGRVVSLQQRDVAVVARVDCGAEFEVHITPAARRALQLERGSRVWLVIKTYSCHVLQDRG